MTDAHALRILPAMKTRICPECKKKVAREHFACASGAKGGRATGKNKARSTILARAAALARWRKDVPAGGK